MRLDELAVQQYGPLRNVTLEPADGIQVIYGPNESGKTLFLEAVCRLLAPDVTDYYDRMDRVHHDPSGYAMLAHGGETTKLGDGTTIDDAIDCTPRDLRNVFVIRDGDLRLDNQHGYYDAVTQRVGDLHTNELDAITDGVLEYGRLTPERRNLSKKYDGAKSVRNEAQSLADEIREYLDEARVNDIDKAERRVLQTARELEECNRTLKRQRQAQVLDRYETLSDRLEEYREATEALDASTVDSDELVLLNEHRRDREGAEETIEKATQNRNNAQTEKGELKGELREIQPRSNALEDRENAVDNLEESLKKFRKAHDEAIGTDWSRPVAAGLTLLGIGLGSAGLLTQVLLPGAVILGLGLLGLVWFLLAHRSRTGRKRAEHTLLDQARDAGFEVETPDDVAPAIQSYRETLQSTRAQVDSLKQDVKVQEQLVKEKNEEIRNAQTDLVDAEEAIQSILTEAEHPSIESYEDAVKTLEEHHDQQQQAKTSLSDALGTPDDDTSAGKIDHWSTVLEAMIEEVPDDVSAEEYNETKLAKLESRFDKLDSQHRELEEKLEDHEERLEQFSKRIDKLDARPFLDERLTLEARSLPGLEQVADECEALADQIDRRADAAREALDIFEDLEAEEEQKLGDLFGPDSRATAVFEQITDGRYETVDYDADATTLRVHRDTDETIAADELSRGTREQLYLAARVGLAEELLGREPGFFLLDDAFLPADPQRLREGFAVLEQLADEGWQIVYFTAKREVGEEMVDACNLACERLEPLP